MALTASRNCKTAVRNALRAVRESSSSMQRDLNRSLLPQVQQRMETTYSSARSAPRGPGVFARMKEIMHQQSSLVVQSLFSEAKGELLRAINNMIEKLSSMTYAICRSITHSLMSIRYTPWLGRTTTRKPRLTRRCKKRFERVETPFYQI